MASASRSPILLAIALMCAMQQAMAHGGGLHDWTWTTPGYENYTRILLATAKPFSLYNASTAASYLPGALPFYPSYAPPANASGSLTIWEYLDSTCVETYTMIADLTFVSPNGMPLALEKVYIWGFTGSCATGVQDLYRHNATLGDARGNLVWAGREEIFTNENGTLGGSAPNIFFPRQNSTSAGPALTSILLAPNPQASTLLCADLTWTAYDLAAWKQKVASCVVSPPSRRRSSRRHSSKRMA